MSDLIIDSKTKLYLRYSGNINEIVKNKLKAYYNYNVSIANSGLHANYLALNTVIQYYNRDCNIVYINELYHESIDLICNFRQNGINTYSINILDDELIINLFKTKISDKNNILFIESCTNPNGYIFNFDIISKLRELSKKLIVICDNSWLTNIIFNPFNYNIDIITISLTKYYSGGNAICGACIIKNNDIYNILDNYIKISGIHISPLQLEIINNNIDCIYNRINITSDLTIKTINYINNLDKDIIINHPYNNDLAKKYFNDNLYPSSFTIGFYILQDDLYNILDKLTIINIETSFGSKLSIIDKYVFMINDYSFIRLSIGYEDNYERIIKGIEELLIYIN